VSDINLGYRTAAQVRERMDAAIGQIKTDAQMLCDELRLHEASYEMLLQERNMLLAQLKAIRQERDEADAARASLKAERDEARMEILSGLVTYDKREYAKDRRWPDTLAALEETARESYKGGD
jgi:chromosome segregation ATPase